MCKSSQHKDAYSKLIFVLLYLNPLLFALALFVLQSGLYGHSAVYHEQTDAIYVFGGYRFHVETVEPSGELYSLYYLNLTWSLLVPSQGNKVRGQSSLFSIPPSQMNYTITDELHEPISYQSIA